MARKMTKAQVLAMFKEEILPYVVTKYGINDRPAKAEAWNNFTDSLCTDGYITRKQNDTWSNPY